MSIRIIARQAVGAVSNKVMNFMSNAKYTTLTAGAVALVLTPISMTGPSLGAAFALVGACAAAGFCGIEAAVWQADRRAAKPQTVQTAKLGL